MIVYFFFLVNVAKGIKEYILKVVIPRNFESDCLHLREYGNQFEIYG